MAAHPVGEHMTLEAMLLGACVKPTETRGQLSGGSELATNSKHEERLSRWRVCFREHSIAITNLESYPLQ